MGNRESFPNPLSDPAIIAELNLAWQQSRAHDPAERHEEGGYILLTSDGFLRVERWRRGDQSHIVPPPLDVNGCYNGNEVVAAFHTHPNPAIDEMGQEWEQGPGESDRRWHQHRKLRGIVVSQAMLYEIDSDGNITVIGKRDEVL